VDPGQKNFDFYRKISEKFRFLQAISQKIWIFPGKYLKNLDFSRQICKKIDFLQANFKKSDFSGNLKTISSFQAKIAHLQLLLGKFFYFSSKVATFEHTSCTFIHSFIPDIYIAPLQET